MTPLQFREALWDLGWSNVHLADLLGCNEKLVRRWARGDAPIPPSVAEWLTKLGRCHEKHPPPTDWRVL